MSAPAVRVSSRPARSAADAKPAWRAHLADGWLLRLVSVVAILVFWELYGRSTNPILFTYPSAVAGAAYNMTAEGILLEAIGKSLLVLGVGLAAGTVVK